MGGTHRVVVVGDGEVRSTAGALDAAEEALDADVGTLGDVTAAIDCVVYQPDGESVPLEALEDRPGSVPIVLFADGLDAAEARAALSGPVADVVPRSAEAHIAVLAHRIRRVVGGTTTQESAPTVREETLDRISDAVVSFDDDWRFTYVNDRAAELLETDPGAVLGEPAWECFPEAVGTPFETELVDAVEAGEERSFEAHYGPRDEWFRVQVYPDAAGVSVYFTTVTERKEAELELERNERALRELQSLAAARGDIEDKLGRALEIGCDRLDLPVGFLTNIREGRQHIVAAEGDHGGLQPGESAPLSEAYCRKTIESDGLLAVVDAPSEGWTDDPAYERYGLGCYLGGKVLVHGELFGTFCFAAEASRDRTFSESERTFIQLLTEWVGHELERRERKHDLERYEAVVEAVDDGVYELDADGVVTFVNEALCDILGVEAVDLLGEPASTVLPEASAEESKDVVRRLLADGEESATYELEVEAADRGRVPCENNVTVLRDGAGEFRGTVGVLRDVTEQREYRERLSRLLASSRTLMQARSREAVAEMVVTAASEVLGFDRTDVWLYDRDVRELELVTAEDRPRTDLGEGPAGEVFADGETRVLTDEDPDATSVATAMYFPMGVHGTVRIGSSVERDVTDVDRQLGALLATSAAAACTRAQRETELRDAHARIDALVDRIEGLIVDTIEVLVQATTREEIEREVCDRIVDADPYECAWIGRIDVAGDAIVPSETGFCGCVDDVSIPFDEASSDPCVRALVDGEPRVATDVAATAGHQGEDAACAVESRGMIAIPLTYKTTTYGVLCVYGTDPEGFAERERVVLAALGRAIGNAMNAIERGRVFTTDQVVELSLSVRDDALLFCRLSDAAECRLASVGTIQQGEDRLHLYVEADGDAEAVLAAAREDPDVSSVDLVVDREDAALFELAVEDDLLMRLAERGVLAREVSADTGEMRLTVEFPYETETREVFTLVADRYDGVNLVGYHEHERPARTSQEFRAAVLDRFTDRQEAAVRTAFLGGFFEWPRDVDGNELAEGMGVTRPTFHQHLRAAQRKVLEELFEPDAASASRGVDS